MMRAEDPNSTSMCPPAKRHLNDDGPTIQIFQGILTSIAQEPYIFVIFQGGGSGPVPPPPLDPHMTSSTNSNWSMHPAHGGTKIPYGKVAQGTTKLIIIAQGCVFYTEG